MTLGTSEVRVQSMANGEDDRGITSAAAMRTCGYGHFDHIHIDLTLSGSEAQTSFWGFPRQMCPHARSLRFCDVEFGGWEWRTMINFVAVSARSGVIPPRFSTIVRSDWNSDGVSDELFAWDPATGAYRL